jgi:hypothetical protein
MSFPLLPAAKVFLAAVVIYAAAFGVIQYFRNHNGSWKVTFQSDATGVPSIRIDQAALGIQGVTLRFPGERHATNNVSIPVDFDKPMRALPFGTRVFEDLTFLPGVETFDLFGHEIEIAPRVLVVNRREIPWASARELSPSPSEKLPASVREKPRKRP